MSSPLVDWSICPTTDTFYKEIVAGGTTVYLRGEDCLTAVDTENGTLNWHRSVDRVFECIVASEFGLVGISKDEGQTRSNRRKSYRLFSFDAEDGSQRWERDVPAQFYDLCLQEEDLFFGFRRDDEVQVRALDVSTGGVSWDWSVSSLASNISVVSSLTSTYVRLGSTIHAFDRQSGTYEWQSDFESFSTLSTSLYANPLTVSRGNVIEAVDPTSGSAIWTFSRQIEPMLAEHAAPDHLDDEVAPGCGGQCEAPDEFVLRVVGSDTEVLYIAGHFRTSYTRRADMEWWAPDTDHMFVVNREDGAVEHQYRIPPCSIHSTDIEYSTCFGALLIRDESGISGYDPRTGNENWQVSLDNQKVVITDDVVVAVGREETSEKTTASSSNQNTVIGVTPASDDTQIYVSRCPNCNADLSEYAAATFCPKCGIDTSRL